MVMQTKVTIGLFRNRLNIATLELLENGEYALSINAENRERLLKDNFPFDNCFQQKETMQICQSLPTLFRELIPKRAKDIKRYGITPEDSDWEQLIKSAIHGNPKSDHTYIQAMPIYEMEPRVKYDPNQNHMRKPLSFIMRNNETITFGKNNWIMLDAKDGFALMLSEFVIETRVYDTLPQGPVFGVEWEISTIRSYLNGQFYNESFSDDEKGYIAKTLLQNKDNPWYGLIDGNDTEDKIFLLSMEEVIMYFGDSGDSGEFEEECVISDQYNHARIAYDNQGIASSWALRTPGIKVRNVAFVNGKGMFLGDINVAGRKVTKKFGIRPAFWLDTRWLYRDDDLW